jgi:RNA polymerase sigma-70 factor (ECF subfamily)
MLDDDQLMIRLQSGDAEAFESLVERYQGPLVGFFLRNTRDTQLSEDLTQETLLKVYNQSWDYLPLGRFRAWMYRIARNLLIDDVRRRSNDALVRAVRAQRDAEEDVVSRLADDLLPPSDDLQHREFARIVDELLEELPEEQRLTFTLHHFSELSLPEVADIMAIPLATCKSRLRLAREKLSEKLRRRGIGPPGEELVEYQR